MSRPHLAFLTADRLSYNLPDGRPLLDGVSLGVADERTGLVGANGSGKSTLLRLLAGAIEPTRGTLVRRGTIGYLPQAIAPRRDATVGEQLGIADALGALDRLLGGAGSAADVERVGDAWDLRERAHEALARVGLGGLPLSRTLGSMSGGEGTRLALAAILLRDPDVLLLDEPSNHLDAAARSALHDVIERWPRGLVIASHDRALLARMDRIVELSSLGARHYGGGYDAYRAQRDEEVEAARRALSAARVAVKRTGMAVREVQERKARQDARGKRSRDDGSQPKLVLNAKRERSQGTSRRLAAEGARLLDDGKRRLGEARSRVEERATPAFVIPAIGLHARRRVVEVRGASVTPRGAARPVVRDCDLSVVGPERIAITGANGAGKSTILRLLAGRLAPDEGEVTHGVAPADIALLDQHVEWPLPDGSLLENFLARSPESTPAHAREALAAFLFRGDAPLQRVSTLSGGEALRGALAMLLHAARPPRFLLLDEPTNHLDLDGTEAVERALLAWDGALVVVSHDDVFLSAIRVTRRLALLAEASPGATLFVVSPSAPPGVAHAQVAGEAGADRQPGQQENCAGDTRPDLHD